MLSCDSAQKDLTFFLLLKHIWTSDAGVVFGVLKFYIKVRVKILNSSRKNMLVKLSFNNKEFKICIFKLKNIFGGQFVVKKINISGVNFLLHLCIENYF